MEREKEASAIQLWLLNWARDVAMRINPPRATAGLLFFCPVVIDCLITPESVKQRPRSSKGNGIIKAAVWCHHKCTDMKVIETAELPAKLMLLSWQCYCISYVGWAAQTGPQWPQPPDPHYPLDIMGTSALLTPVPFCCQKFLQQFHCFLTSSKADCKGSAVGHVAMLTAQSCQWKSHHKG